MNIMCNLHTHNINVHQKKITFVLIEPYLLIFKFFRLKSNKSSKKQVIWRQYNLHEEGTRTNWVSRRAWTALENLEYFTAELEPELLAEADTRFQWLAMEHAYEGAYTQFYTDNLDQFLRADVQRCAYESR